MIINNHIRRFGLSFFVLIGIGIGIWLAVPHLLAADSQVTDLKVQSSVSNQTIQLTVSDQNNADQKVVIMLNPNLDYESAEQGNAAVTYDRVNHQIVVDWLANRPKNTTVLVKAKKAGTYVFKAQTTREQMPCNSVPVSAIVKEPEITAQSSSFSSSVLNSSQSNQPIVSESDNTISQSTEVKEETSNISDTNNQKTDDNLNHADTDIVTPEALDNSQWLLKALSNQGIDIAAGTTTYGDLKKVTDLIVDGQKVHYVKGNTPKTIKYFTNVQNMGVTNTKKTSPTQMSGEIPKEIGLLKELRTFDFPWTDFSGEFPSEFGQLTKLKSLKLSGCQVSGSVADVLDKLSKHELKTLWLDRTDKLVGIVPDKLLDDKSNKFDYSQITALNPGQKRTWIHNAFIRSTEEADLNEHGFLTNELGLPWYANYTNLGYDVSHTTAGFHFKMIIGQSLSIFNQKKLPPSDNVLDLQLGSERVIGVWDKIGDAPHTYQITDNTGKLIYDGPFDPSVKLKPTFQQKNYYISIDHTKEIIKDDKYGWIHPVGTLRIYIDMKAPNFTQTLLPEDPKLGENGVVTYIPNKAFNMISTVKNTDRDDYSLATLSAKVKTTDKNLISIDNNSFAIQKMGSTTWEPVKATDVIAVADGYQINMHDLNLKSKETVKLRYSAKASQPFTDTSVLINEGTLTNTMEIPTASTNLVIKNGEFKFVTVPDTMSFQNSSILGTTVELKRQIADWTMQVEDTRLKKNDWHVTMQLIAPFKNSANDTLPDSLIYRKSGESDQIIGNVAIDAYDGHSTDTEDLYDIRWSSGNGPLLKVRPGIAKLGQYQGVMEWTLVDGPV